MDFNITFAPELPLWLIITVAALTGILVAYGLVRKLRGSVIRTGAWALLIFALFNPAILREDREPLKSVVAIVIDKSASQKLDQRQSQTQDILKDLRSRISKMGNFEIREIEALDNSSVTTDATTTLFKSLKTALQDVPSEQIAGAIFITDGQVHDIPERAADIGFKAPVHALITGRTDEKDRRLKIINAPRFGVVGESHEIIFMVEQTGFDDPDRPLEVTIRFDGQIVARDEITPGLEGRFIFDVPHGGKNIIELSVEADEEEITPVNNRAFTTLNGIRENLRVLLVSGEPHAGERTWRNLLKSDGSVDLVHFTILRPPEKQDGTPISQLSLIAFPTRELFVQKIDEFDLIIFDRYQRRGVLPLLYFENIARYVRDGGAILVAAGPEYAIPGSIGNTPLSSVLPGVANGQVLETPFKPRLHKFGMKHPVTRDLDGWNEKDPNWSRWFRSIGVDQLGGDTVMVDEVGNPLLMLNRAGEGRVALFLSDHAWLWARGFEGGGPYVQLLRRIAHWLMKEPELDEERLTANASGKTISLQRQSLSNKPGDVELQGPTGETQTITLSETKPGIWSGQLEVDDIGLYQAKSDSFTALAQVGPANPREFSTVISTPKLLKPLLEKHGGTVLRAKNNSAPRILPVRPGSKAFGKNWLGLNNTNASALKGIDRIPLFSGLLGLALLLFALTGMWLREGR